MTKHSKVAQSEAAAQELKMEYASVTISVDHLVREPHPDGHVVVKNVFSTETAVESLLAQLDYFQDNAILRRQGIVSMISKGEEKAAVFVYEVNGELTNIIVDVALWDEALAREGTVMGTHAAFMTLCTDMKRTANAEGRSERVLAFLSE